MLRIACHNSLVGCIILLAFLFSTNSLLFGSHLVEEMLLQTTQVAGGADDVELLCGNHSPSHHHDHSHHSHTEAECCDAHGPHSHDLRSSPPLLVSPTLPFSQHRFFDLTAAIPEIYLERFIPPQNRA